ncbi:MAG: sugar-binding protein [Bacteroidota bacterium]
MKNKLTLFHLAIFTILMAFSLNGYSQAPFTVSTYNCISVYWSPTGGANNKKVLIEYSEQGSSTWKNGFPMVYHPIAGTTRDKADYRGSIVNLKSNTTYQIRLTLEGTTTPVTLNATTWNDNPPEGTVVNVASQNTTYAITQSGTPTAYRVYDGTGSTINVNHTSDNCITVDAQYVILRGFTLRGAGTSSTTSLTYAIRILGGSDIIIENCDISDWGKPSTSPLVPNHGSDRDFAIGGKNTAAARITVQRNKIHDPTYTANNWEYGHPAGPQGIGFYESVTGNHVIRYNECWSTNGNYFNDIIGYSENGSYTGFPGDDSDIYGNYLTNSWDDGIEAEGGGQNVRIWNNYITDALMAIGNAAVSIGPYYVFRNVSGRCSYPQGTYPYGNFMKMGFANSESWMTGTIFVFHNTIFQVNSNGFSGLGGSNRIIKHCYSRNNILQTRSTASNSIAISSTHTNNDFNYDLYNKTVPSGSETNGISGIPTYVTGAGFNSGTKTGNFQLETTSLGFDDGEVIPNFSDGFFGAGPDMGAHENGCNSMQYGVNAQFTPCTNNNNCSAVTIASTPTITNVTCTTCNNGAINLSSATGGAAPYTYSWSNGATTQNISNLTYGTYTVTVTDKNGCFSTFKARVRILFDILKTPTTPVIDGSLSEYSGSNSISFKHSSAATNVTVNAMWNDSALYLGYDVPDTKLNGVITAKDGNIWDEDAVEFFIDTQNDEGTALQNDDYQFIVNILNTQLDNKGVTGLSWNGNWQSAVITSGTANNNSDNDIGYAMEVRIPWKTIGYANPPAVNSLLGMDFAHDDFDATVNKYVMWPAETSNFPNPSKWQLGRLLGTQISTSVNKSEKDNLINVYPNPSDGNFNISFRAVEKETYNLNIKNVLGQVIYQETLIDFIGDYSKSISVANYGKGIYLIILSNNKNEMVKKMIVY